ncbi:MAG: RidA family protein [bacterium]|nr:RidA family protein [bacterium]
MRKTAHQATANLHQPFANYSHVVAVEGVKKLVFTAGQVSATPDGTVAGEGDFAAQQAQIKANLIEALAAGGATLADVVKVTIYVVRQEDTPKGRGVLTDYFGDFEPPPGSTLCVLRGLANPAFLLEVEAIAAIG